MRVFQPVEPEEIESGAYTFSGKKLLVTAGDGTRVNTGVAANGGVGQMWGKRVTFICVRENRYTKELIEASGEYSLSFLDNDEFRGAFKYLEAVSGKDEDKIKGARLNVGFYEGVPFIEESSNVLICKVIYRKEISPEGFVDQAFEDAFYKDGTKHIIYVGELVKVLIR